MDKNIQIKEEIEEPNSSAECKNLMAKTALAKTLESNVTCCSKLETLQHWESIKRIGMMNLLEEVIQVQGMEKRVNRLEKQKQIKSEEPTHVAHNADENSRGSYDSEDELAEENDTKELAAADKSIENLTKTTFNTIYKFEDIYQLMIKFAKPCLDKQTIKCEKLQTKPKIAKNMLNREEGTNTITKKRKRNSSVVSCATPTLSELRNKNGEKQHKRPQLPNDDGKSTNIIIGANGTSITRKAWNTINWSLSGPAITRKILMEVFDRNILAFHTLTGKPSPAFTDYDMPKKNQLDAEKVADIIEFMTQYFDMTPREVRSAITTKCADENKMHRQRQQKNIKSEPVN